MKPTPPISLWVSTPTTCTMTEENTNRNIKLCATKRWSRFKVWLAETCHNHDMGVKPQTLYLNKLFVECGDNLATLWDTVVMSNEYVQEPTKMFGDSNKLC